MISPFFNGTSLGIPCTTCEFGLAQRVFGKSYKPKNPGIPSLSLMNSSANLSSFSVVTPSFISFAISPSVLDTNKALSLINSISSNDFCKFIISIIRVFRSFQLVFQCPLFLKL